MGNYWITLSELEKLTKKLTDLYTPYIDTIYISDQELLDSMHLVQSVFLAQNPKYTKYIGQLRVFFITTKFREDDKIFWRLDGFEIRG